MQKQKGSQRKKEWIQIRNSIGVWKKTALATIRGAFYNIKLTNNKNTSLSCHFCRFILTIIFNPQKFFL